MALYDGCLSDLYGRNWDEMFGLLSRTSTLSVSPCPFCGSVANLRTWTESNPPRNRRGNPKVEYYVRCSVCGIQTKHESCACLAVSTWNKRTSTKAKPAAKKAKHPSRITSKRA